MSRVSIALPAVLSLPLHTLALLALLCLGLAQRPAAAAPAYITMPAAGPEQVVFTCEGDLWSVPWAGGIARRLTRHPGQERWATFSPDGKTLAFTAQYEGGEDVYTMPSAGGPVKRLTFHPDGSQVVCWTPDGQWIVFRSIRDTAHGRTRLWKVAAAGGVPQLLPLGEAALASFSPDGQRVAFNRVSREFRYWKRYRGGTQQNLWWTDLATHSYRQLSEPEFRGTDGWPMWVGRRIYFASDRDGVMNLWSMDEEGHDLRQHTHHTDFDVRWPSAFGDRIVYSCGADLWMLDLKSGNASRIDVDVPSDRPLTSSHFIEPAKYMEDPVLTPDGKRVVLGVRGDIYMVAPGPDEARALNLTGTPGIRERAPDVSPDGKQIACLSDAGGEEHLAVVSTDGSGATTAVTTETGAWHFPPQWSPDGTRLAWADQDLALRVADVKTHSVKEIDRSTVWELDDYAWSPDGRWLAYARMEENRLRRLWVADAKTGQTHAVSEGDTDAYSPAWDPEGKYLYFLSDRDLNPILDSLDFVATFDSTTRPYLVLLKAGAKSPFFAKELEEEQQEEAQKEKKGKDKDKDKDKEKDGEKDHAADKGKDRSREKAGDLAHQPPVASIAPPPSPAGAASPAPFAVVASPRPGPLPASSSSESAGKSALTTVDIDFDGIQDRIVALPVEPGHYSHLSAIKGKVLYISRPPHGLLDDKDLFSQDKPPRFSLQAFDLSAKEAKPLVESLSAYNLSRDGKKLVFRKKEEIKVIDVEKGEGPGEEKAKKGKEKGLVSLDRLPVRIDPPVEWAQIFREAWRLQREFYWAPNMAGIDWAAMYKRYAPLLSRVATRIELNDLIGELIGELANSHTYVMGGDTSSGEKSRYLGTGLLGADLSPDAKANAWKVDRVLKGLNWSEDSQSPLALPHAHVKPGDYITAIDRRPLTAADNLDERMQGLAGQPVLLSVAASPHTTSRDVLIKALHSDRRLRYVDWVTRNRERVDHETGGRCAYLHVPDMMGEGLVEFMRGFIPAVRKHALIIDARYNRGGFVSQLLIEKLRRQLYAMMQPRHGAPETYPQYVVHGHLIWLCDRNAGSDGDIGPMSFKLLKLGPVVGTRTWGGVVGIRGNKFFVDGGLTTQPEFAWWSPETGWSPENSGVEPDVLSDNAPGDQAAGLDVPLAKAIEMVNAALAKDPKLLPSHPPYPDKSFDAFKKQK